MESSLPLDIAGHIEKLLSVTIPSDKFETNMFSAEIDIFARDLVYLVNKLEEIYGVRFEAEDILSDQIYTVNGLASLISQKYVKAA